MYSQASPRWYGAVVTTVHNAVPFGYSASIAIFHLPCAQVAYFGNQALAWETKCSLRYSLMPSPDHANKQAFDCDLYRSTVINHLQYV